MSAPELVVWSIPAGTRLLDRYVTGPKLGDGATGAVYRARDERDDRDVALKILDPFRGADPIGRARFARELEVLSKINHPGVARAFSLESEGELEILALELVEGESLRARIDRGRLPVAEAIGIATQLAAALGACHAQGVLHRDVKPDNVIVHPERGAVLLDFSVAWFTAAATLTRTGASIGTPQYLAPEALATSHADGRTDLYALGVVLFEMLTGRTPRSDDPMEAIESVDRTPPTLFSLRPEAGPALSSTVARAMSPRAEDRFATAEELISALRGRALVRGPSLEARLPCAHCGVGRIVDLPFCPGCGREVVWELSTGPYAVQLESLESPARVASWLSRRHPAALRARAGMLERRLRLTPVPLAMGVSHASAEQLASEARDAGAVPVVIHTRRLGGPRFSAAQATNLETLSMIGLHFFATLSMGALVAWAGLGLSTLVALPGSLAIAGVFGAIWYARRGLLRCETEPRPAPDPRLTRIQGTLGGLTQDRARRLAAQAISRASSVLLHDVRGLSSSATAEVFDALEEAVTAARAAQDHLELVLAHPRARLGAAIEAARVRGDVEEVATLESLHAELTEAAIAHDVEVRRSLVAASRITDVLSNRS